MPEGTDTTYAPAGIRKALRRHFECVACRHVRSNSYALRACGHVVCKHCVTKEGACTRCGKRYTKAPPPLGELERDVLRFVFGKTPAEPEALAVDVVEEMRARGDEINMRGYEQGLDAELAAVGDPAGLTRCRCGLVCIRRTSKAGKLYYGCPGWHGEGTGCKFFAWVSAAAR